MRSTDRGDAVRQQMVVALVISRDGRKGIHSICYGATENATVVGELLVDLVNRGLDFREQRLYELDGGKSAATAVKDYDSALSSPQATHRVGYSDRGATWLECKAMTRRRPARAVGLLRPPGSAETVAPD